MADESPPAQGRTWFSDAVLLAISTAVAYAVSFTFETAYADYFGYPWWLIEVDIGKLLIAWAAILTVVAFFFMFFSSLAIGLSSRIAKLFLLVSSPIT
jgi:hypothetical protein